MRIRSIKPEFWRSDDISHLNIPDRLLFVGLWSYVDDSGIGIDKVANICADLFAHDLEANPPEVFARVTGGLQTLNERGLIVRYVVAGRRYLHITNWSSHQRIDKPGRRRYPGPDEGETENSGSPREDSGSPRESPAPGAGEQGSSGTGEQGSRSADKPRKKPAHTIPDDWKPTAAHQKQAAERRVDLSSEAFRFRNHAHSIDRRIVNWNSAFTNWLDKAYPDRNQPRAANDQRPEGW